MNKKRKEMTGRETWQFDIKKNVNIFDINNSW